LPPGWGSQTGAAAIVIFSIHAKLMRIAARRKLVLTSMYSFFGDIPDSAAADLSCPSKSESPVYWVGAVEKVISVDPFGRKN
jgi:hypothetical protein